MSLKGVVKLHYFNKKTTNIMWTIIIIVFIGLCVSVYISRKDDYGDIVFYILNGMLSLLISLPLSSLLAFTIHAHAKVIKSEFEIESLQDGNSISGNFFLGSGIIEGKMVYTLYLSDDEGYKLYQIDSEEAHIRYSKRHPSLIQYETVKNDDFINNFSFYKPTIEYTIEVPKGTILNNYTLDSK